MNIYDSLLATVEQEYDTVKVLKESERSRISLVRHHASGSRFVLRQFEGCAEVYKKLLGLSSPHLPRIIEVGEADGRTVVLEEYIMGDTLAFILEGGLLSIKETRGIMRQLCRGVWGLHSVGAVHRDIKPENVMLRGDEVVLIDFDASRIYKHEQETDTQILGTNGYAAPEQYGLSQSDERADIYAMGVLLNIMLTGKHPSKELAAGYMGRIIQRCTMVNPKKRFQNVLQLMEVM